MSHLSESWSRFWWQVSLWGGNRCIDLSAALFPRWLWGSHKLFPETILACSVTYQMTFRKRIFHHAILGCTLIRYNRSLINAGIVIAAMILSIIVGCRFSLSFSTHVIMDAYDNPQPVCILIYMYRNNRARDKSEEGRPNEGRISTNMVVRLLVFSSFPIIGITWVIRLYLFVYELTLHAAPTEPRLSITLQILRQHILWLLLVRTPCF